MTPQSALFYAAGLGTRMAPLTLNYPKPLIKVSGKPLLFHALDFADEIENKVVNTHYKADLIKAALPDHIVISHEADKRLETGGGLRRALPLLRDNPVFTMNTDAVWGGAHPFKQLAETWRPHYEALLLLIPLTNTRGHTGTGDFSMDAQGRITRKGSFVYSGAQIIKTDRFRAETSDVFSTNIIWNQMIEAGTLFGVVYDGLWCDVGRPESIHIAEKMLSNV